MQRDDLYKHLKENTQVLRNEGVRKAFEVVDRADFVGADYESEAYEDYALPLADNETITKPTIVAFMLELLDVQRGESVLEVGSGSGWVIALLSELTGAEGKVVGTEVIPSLVERGRKNIAKYDTAHASIEQAEGEAGNRAGGPYDRIICTSTASKIPNSLISQLKEGGTIVMPVEGMIIRGVKKHGRLNEERFSGTFMFEELK